MTRLVMVAAASMSLLAASPAASLDGAAHPNQPSGAPTTAPQLSFDEALSICREAMFGDNAAAMKRFKALSENDRRNVDVACTAYAHGIQDYISASRSAGMRASELRSRT